MIKTLKNNYGQFNDIQKIGPAIWKWFDLIVVNNGRIKIFLQKKEEIEIETNQAVLIFPQTRFRGHSIVETTRVSVHHFNIELRKQFLPDSLKHLCNKNKGWEIFTSITDNISTELDRIIKLEFNSSDQKDRDIMDILMSLVLCELYKTKKSAEKSRIHDNSFQEFTDWLKNNLNQNISLDQMAEYNKLSTSYFRTVFKNKTGITAGQFYFNLRMQEGARLLRETLLPIKLIAKKVGYNDISHFYRAFKKTYKTPPLIYRKQNIVKG